MSLLNEVFTKVYYINLDSRTKRRQQLEQQLTELDIVAERWPATKGSPYGFIKGLSFPEVGCLHSHLRIIEEAKKLDLPSVLILEDDCVFVEHFEFRFYEAYRMVPKDWQMLYLGSNDNTPFAGKISHKLNNYVYRSLSSLTTHAYALKKEVYDLFINEIKKLACSLDLCYIKITPLIKAYCLKPSLVTQRAGWSDVQQTFVDYSDCIK